MRRFDSVRFEDVSYRYGRRRTALDHVSFRLGIGMTVLLGPNGAGKSTLIGILSTLLTPGSGTVSYGRIVNPKASAMETVRSSIGYLPQDFEAIEWSSVRRNVEYAAWAHGVPGRSCAQAAETAIRDMGLTSQTDTRARELSGGMRQRLGLACAIAHRPSLLILDEPTVGIDPMQRVHVREMIRRYARRSMVIMSTHMVEELHGSASHVLVLNEGGLVFDGDLTSFAAIGNNGMTAHQTDREDVFGGSELESSYIALMRSSARGQESRR
ncbi:ABC transporter, ATP-binding protein [Bifidobacterium callitrichos DSM 23973]|uniref:ABC transporter, ATP-binding protein n=2 Tax=Bifidobacterium callitrichos TaxID=762209 RepID=A0A087AD06_9BIFI|nr:ABC transporter ATP-binding protein [Bifidobacterium callitrichos]KFI56656.1 ABC transporter, ATP-binding protein [Bifidobacterium callitrichos DSM 23973]